MSESTTVSRMLAINFVSDFCLFVSLFFLSYLVLFEINPRKNAQHPTGVRLSTNIAAAACLKCRC